VCRQAKNGKGALATDAEFAPDVVFLDIGLPDISGYEVARRLRSRRGRAVYLAALTGWGQAEDRLRALAAGFDQHILKPADGRVLSGVLVAAESRRRRPTLVM
jgi:DNA-binding response OmpR family regulator